ncbi:MAG: capsular polysaccharide biosynthesis protein [Rhodobacteraceae bacterium]|nr:MAG: capsular polysaccharide biosynthesis protein [Paracoccaceae bacterium]
MTGEPRPSPDRRRLCVYNGGFLTEGRLRRILELAGWDISLGVPGDGDTVGIWGRTPTAWRGEAVAEWRNAPVLTVEDAFLRSVHPGRVRGEAPMGLCLDLGGVHFDGSTPSDLEALLAAHPLDDTALLNRARDALDSMKHWHLGKYSATDPDLPVPEPGYVVLIDQTAGDAALMGAGRAAFNEMLALAAEEHPGLPILIKSHPESVAGKRDGHFAAADLPERVRIITEPVSPWRLFEGAVAVYTHSSTLGFEAIFAGLKPRVFGQPFYAGWGLTQDQDAPARRERVLTRAQLFAGAMILYPVWYDPVGDRLCEVEEVIAQLAAEARAWREDRDGYVAVGMRVWKRPHLKRAFGREKPLKFASRIPSGGTRKPVVWGMAEAPEGILRMEDGFLRSRGLGAALTPPLSLVLDAPTLYFDPRQEGKLDRLIGNSSQLPDGEMRRAERLIDRIRAKGLTKYNISGALPDIPGGARHVLVVGQVEDDASVTFGAGDVKTNLDLLRRARQDNPDATILWKPHPDVEAGLRTGTVASADLEGLADIALLNIGAAEALELADEVWTITSTLGFEALVRGRSVTCLGMPFYAGRGLTRDLVARPEHRAGHDVTLAQLVHACLIGYPRYFDPRTGAPLSPENALALLADGIETPPVNRWAAWLQSLIPTFGR